MSLRPLAACFLAVSLTAAPLRADDAGDALRAAAEAHGASVVRVRATVSLVVERLPGLGKGARRTHEVEASGVVVSKDGLVILCASSLDPARGAFALLGSKARPDIAQVRVVGKDGRIRAAEWLGIDPASSLALVRVAEAGRSGLTPAAFEGGAVDLGARLGVMTLTPSALGTHVQAEATRVAFVGEGRYGISPQLPLALGGLVVDGQGKPLGILAPLPGTPHRGDLLRPGALAVAQAGYLLPAASFQGLVASPPKPSAHPTVRRRGRAWLGIQHQIVSTELAERLGLDIDVGVRVAKLYEGPAKAAGLEEGDILVRMDGEPLDLDPGESFDDLVADYGVGSKVPFLVRRGTKVKEVELELARGPTTPADAQRILVAEAGLVIRELTFFDRDQAGLDAKASGAVVLEVPPDGAASRAGVRAGDLILKIDGEPPQSLEDLRERLLASGAHPLTIRRKNEELTLRVRH